MILSTKYLQIQSKIQLKKLFKKDNAEIPKLSLWMIDLKTLKMLKKDLEKILYKI